jgi:hypothetical protein
MPFMQGSVVAKRVVLAVILAACSAGASFAQSSASHKIIMSVKLNNRFTAVPAVNSTSFASQARDAESPALKNSRTMNLSYSSGGSADTRKTVISVAGLVLPGVSLKIASKGAEDDTSRELRTNVNLRPASYDVSGMIAGDSPKTQRNGTSAITISVANDDPETKTEADSGFVFITYTIL